jgi:ATP-dependent Clp protease adapter protein ClpS
VIKYAKDVTVYVHINGKCVEGVVAEDSGGGRVLVKIEGKTISVYDVDLCNGNCDL